MLSLQIPEAFEPLLYPKRFKVYYGGRASAKSHNFARALLIKGMEEKLRVLCARELQVSITDSVHKLLSDIILSHGLGNFYEIQRASIIGINGTEFIFKGLRHNASEIKSTEGIDICWVEEAEKVSDNSWELLVPTIRKPGSEIWVSFNTRFPTDPTYVRFVQNADDRFIVKKVTWRDNPFLPDVSREELEALKKSDPSAYDYVWEGNFDRRFYGGVYAELLDKARQEGRITGVPYKPGVPVITAWDLGNSNSTAIWFAQKVGLQPRIIDYYENANKPLDHYAQVIRSKPYAEMTHYLPHDAAHERLGMNNSIGNQLRVMGIQNKKLNISSIQSGIESGRDLVAQAWFDEEKCKAGIHALSHYQFEWDEHRKTFKDKPLKDWSSDAADAFRYISQALKIEYGRVEEETTYRSTPIAGGWMG